MDDSIDSVESVPRWHSVETVSSWFVASKCMIGPLEPMTVPRLELAGAVVGLHLTQHSTLVLGLPLQYVTVYPDIMDIL